MKFWILTAATLLPFTAAMAEPVRVEVLAISQDAKFIGDSMGGVGVELRDARSGKLLAKGKTIGGTGDTKAIMAAQGRVPDRVTPDAARFSAMIEVAQPMLVRVDLHGPLGHPHTMQRASSERWLFPGVNAEAAAAWIIELPGLAIDVNPALLLMAGEAAQISAKVAPMCGCPITPGGMWDASDYVVTAQLHQAGQAGAPVAMAFATAPGGYSANITPGRAGKAELWITARNVKTGNSGMLRLPVRIAKAGRK